MSPATNVSRWFKDRCRTDVIVGLLRQKTVPVQGLSLKHYLGGALLFLFGVQVLTGILLSIYYSPSVTNAFQSVEYLSTQVEYGWLVRSIHKWTSNLIVIFACLHLFTVFWGGAYRAPRELTWISGLLLFGGILAICFFGYVLPWNEISYSATTIGIEVVKKVPLVGTTLVNILQGGSDFSPRLLTVSYMLHILVLPLFLLAVIALHVYLIQVHGMHEPEAGHARPGKKGIRPVPFYPDFMKRISLFWVILLNGVVLLALFLPPELGEPADRLGQTPIGVKPEWYFLFLYQTLKVIPSRILFLDGEMAALLLVFLGALFLFAFPFLGDGLRSGRGGRLARAGVLLFFIYIVVMGIWGHLSQPLALP